MNNFEENTKTAQTDLHAFSKRTLDTLKIGINHLMLLNLLRMRRPISQSELADRCGIDEGTMSKIARTLEDDCNLIYRNTGAELKKIPNLKSNMNMCPNHVYSKQKYVMLSERGTSFIKHMEQICYYLEFSPVQIPLSRPKTLRKEENQKINEILARIREKGDDSEFLIFYIRQLVSYARSLFLPVHSHRELYESLNRIIMQHDGEVKKEAIKAISYLWRSAIIYYDKTWLNEHPWDKMWKIFNDIDDSEISLKIYLVGNAMELLLRAYSLFKEKHVPERFLDLLIQNYLDYLEKEDVQANKAELLWKWEKILREDICLDMDKKYVKETMLTSIDAPNVNVDIKKKVLGLLSEEEYCLI